MVRTQESLESASNETETIISEYREKILEALDLESNKIKDRADRESGQIIARARDEAEQIERKAGKEALELRQETSRIVSETREKASQIIHEITDQRITQTERELARVTSEVKSKTSELLNQVNKSVEQIIAETEKNIKTELERIAAAIAEADKNLKMLGEMCGKEGDSNFQRKTEIEVTPKAPAADKTETAPSSAEDKREVPVIDDDTTVFKGTLKLEVATPYNQERLETVPDWLTRISGLNVVSTEFYTRANRWVTAYNVELEKPISLLRILKGVHQVKDVTTHKGAITMALK